MASANALATLRWKRAKIHRGSRRRRRSLTPHKEAGYTSAVVTLNQSLPKSVAIGRGPYTSRHDNASTNASITRTWFSPATKSSRYSGSKTPFDRVMGGARAAAVFTDPPYNLRVHAIGGRGRIQHPEFAFASGEMSRAQFRSFLSQSLGNGVRVSARGAVHYVCIDWRHIGELSEVCRELYGDMLNIVVLVKSNAGQGSFYRSQHEFIGVFRIGEEPHRNNVELGRFGRNRSNVWTYAGNNTFGNPAKVSVSIPL